MNRLSRFNVNAGHSSRPLQGQSRPSSVPMANVAAASPTDALASSRPSRRPASSQRRPTIFNFPPEVWDNIASHDLSTTDLQRLSFSLGHEVKSALEPRLQSQRCVDKALRLNTLAELTTLLQDIDHLRSDLKLEPLRQTMLHLHALPQADRAEGLDRFRAALAALPIEHPVIEQHPSELDRFIDYPDAIAAIAAGEGVDMYARIFNMTSEDKVNLIRRAVIPTAKIMLRQGNLVQTVAQHFGIATIEGIIELENAAIDLDAYPGTVSYSMRHGGHVNTVAQQYGITTQEGISRLELLTISSQLRGEGTAGHAMLAGFDVQTVAENFGITTLKGLIELEKVTIDRHQEPGTGGYEILNGGHVQIVAKQFGITTQEGLSRLEALTINHHHLQGTAGAALLAAPNVQTVAKQFGITTPAGIFGLEELIIDHYHIDGTAGAEMIAGGHAVTVAKKFGITTTKGITALEKITLLHLGKSQTAWAAIKSGLDAGAVAEKFGITSSEGIQCLEYIAKLRNDWDLPNSLQRDTGASPQNSKLRAR